MKPSVKLIRCLAALAPLALGLLLGGCGGLLGSVEGTGPTTPTTAQPAEFSVSGQAVVENQVASRAAKVLAGATVRVLMVTSPNTFVLATQSNGQPAVTTTDANGAYSLSIQVPAGQASTLNMLWVVQVFAPGVTLPSGATANVMLLGAFVPGAAGAHITRDCNGTSTIVAGNLIATGSDQGVLSNTVIITLENQVSVVVVGANGLKLSDLVVTAGSAEAALTAAQLAGLANQVVAILNATVARIDVVLNSTNTVIGSNPLEVGQGKTVSLTAKAYTQSGTLLPDLGMEWVLTSGSGITITPTGPNTANVTVAAGAAVGSTDVVTARIAVPGATSSPRKSVDVTINVVAHNQGHGQGGGTTY